MDSKAQLTVDIIAKVAEGKITIVNAAKPLNKSSRTIERYLQKYHKVDIQFVIHRILTKNLPIKQQSHLNDKCSL